MEFRFNLAGLAVLSDLFLSKGIAICFFLDLELSERSASFSCENSVLFNFLDVR